MSKFAKRKNNSGERDEQSRNVLGTLSRLAASATTLVHNLIEGVVTTL